MIGMNRHTGKPLQGLDHLWQSLGDLLSTPIGTRVMRRDYGSRVPDLIDSPVDPARAIEVHMAVAEAIHRWEPRFRLRRVQVQVGAASLAGHLELALSGVYLGRMAEGSITL